MISLLCPSRGRPDAFGKMVRSAVAHADRRDGIEIVAYLDDEDDVRPIYELSRWQGERHVVGPRICMGDMWNQCAEAARGDILMQCADDIRFQTPGWDRLVSEAFERYQDRIAFVHGRDLSPNEGIHGTHGFISRRWYEALGYFVPAGFVSDYTDTWLNDLANRIGRRVYLRNLVTEHLHHTLGKAEIDQTTLDRLARHERGRPDLLYAWREPERAADAQKLRALLR
ncbi:MAG: hypothetical protein KGL39_11975 [Patescibacteria group bacterium]|nr:hypothetical protein [Patescibacteria group bacterium]